MSSVRLPYPRHTKTVLTAWYVMPFWPKCIAYYVCRDSFYSQDLSTQTFVALMSYELIQFFLIFSNYYCLFSAFVYILLTLKCILHRHFKNWTGRFSRLHQSRISETTIGNSADSEVLLFIFTKFYFFWDTKHQVGVFRSTDHSKFQ